VNQGMLQDIKQLERFPPTPFLHISHTKVRNSFIMTTFVTDETSFEALDGNLNEG